MHFWNLAERTLEQSIDLGEQGLVPLEIRWLHDPDAEEGFIGAALSSAMWRFHRSNGSWSAEPVITTEGVELEGWPFPVPPLITDLVLSMDDKALYFSNWLHGDLRRYDVSDPANPSSPGSSGSAASWQAERRGPRAERRAADAPALARREALYVTNSLYSTWDNQFYPELRSWLFKVDIGEDGSMEVDRDFFVDFHDRPGGPARAHEVRLQGGDCTTEIFQ